MQGKILFGSELQAVFAKLKANNAALPAINVSHTSVINAVFEVARDSGLPAMMQLSYGGAAYFIGQGIDNKNHQASIEGAILAAKYARAAAKTYGVDLILTTDHCHEEWLPWLDQVLKASEENFATFGEPLFSIQMLDLSVLSTKQNIEICEKYIERTNKIGTYLEIEVGITGGEEDGVDHSDVADSRLYTTPEDIYYAYSHLKQKSDLFLIAASFGNVHGVYAPGNVKLKPEILKIGQDFVNKQIQSEILNPVDFVFHGGSGSEAAKITEALQHGVVKMNVDTDIQWAYWKGVLEYYKQNSDSLQSEIGNSTDPIAPNKKFFDPRKWMRSAEKSVKERVARCYEDLNSKALV